MPFITPDPDIARTEKINRAIRAELDELKRQGYSEYDALRQACRTVAARLHDRDIYANEREEVRAEGRHALWS